MNYRGIFVFNQSFYYLLAFVVALTQTTACSTTSPPPLNKPLVDITGNSLSVKPKPLKKYTRSDDLTLVLTFSGGGTRAAAFTYGVLKQLRDTKLGGEYANKRLLDEVDVISSVSGGSFTAAYYGLFGDDIFRSYESRFLRTPVQSELLKHWLLSPKNWVKLSPTLYNRSDLVADYYANNIFSHKTFADMRPDSPHIVINATDLSAGNAFSFTKDHFRWICSDLDSFPVGRAVVASSAVPVLFSPIVLKNYAGECEPLAYQQEQLNSAALRIDSQAYGVRKYKNREKYDYLHLVDGGVVDNLGIRSLLNLVTEQGNDFWKLMQVHQFEKTRKVAFIVVNASDDIAQDIARSRKEPTTASTLGAVTTIQSQRYNNETLDLLESRFANWKLQVIQGRCEQFPSPDCDEIEFYMAELNFKQLPPDLAEDLSHVETSLELGNQQVSRLISAGSQLLKSSPQFKRLLKDLDD